MERLKHMKENLMNCVESQISGNLYETNAEELGEAIDMIKDLSEAMYYCSVVKAMEECEEEKEMMEYMQRMQPMQMPMYDRSMERNMGRMYYDGGRRTGNPRTGGESEMYNYPTEIRDYREGRSPITRRSYMESKELHHDKGVQIKELEKYMNELTQDMLEMIEEASPEEKAMLSQKLMGLAGKIK